MLLPIVRPVEAPAVSGCAGDPRVELNFAFLVLIFLYIL
jgi:hypothetical protein